MLKLILVILAVVFGYLAYTAGGMGELGIAIGMGLIALACTAGALFGRKNKDEHIVRTRR
ncbi:hypothetical protein KIPE111705_36900 [Kibdelosporangium persicum]|uniref:DUF3188 domain-containing protein n=1 Tax=Kibdelosporangium persicum TaxID=2698649 RepID=A0ABX2F3J4_9PSEU|nr:hypothetical protein [Kibdelosporangium persicum]NRN65906.1 hypothetical protein [Kibdelosporangium persicum]